MRGKKALTVDIGPSIYSIGDWFFEAMKDEIQKNINNPRYTEIMDLDFSTSSLTQKTVNNIMLMYSFKKYFSYFANIGCGIPGVIMTGAERDWKHLIEKHSRL